MLGHWHWGSLEICSLPWGAVSRQLIGNLGASQSSRTVVGCVSCKNVCVLRCYKASLPVVSWTVWCWVVTAAP